MCHSLLGDFQLFWIESEGKLGEGKQTMDSWDELGVGILKNYEFLKVTAKARGQKHR